MNALRVRIFLGCVAVIFATGCPSAPSDPCTGVTCDPNEFCNNGDCVECEGDADCDPDENCVNNTCETALTCCDAFTNCAPKDCVFPNFCVDGACVQCEVTADCDGNGNCPEGGCLCVDGSCVACNDNNACTSDSRVVDEQTVEFVCSYTPVTCAIVLQCPPGCNTACQNNFCVGLP